MINLFKNSEEEKILEKEADFDADFKEKLKTALVISSDEAVKHVLSYLETKIKINTEKMNLLNPFFKKDQKKLTILIAKNIVYGEFIKDFNDTFELARETLKSSE